MNSYPLLSCRAPWILPPSSGSSSTSMYSLDSVTMSYALSTLVLLNRSVYGSGYTRPVAP